MCEGGTGSTAHGGNRGFTLLELVTVLALFLILVSIAVVASTSWGRRAAVRGSLYALKGGLEGARQAAACSSSVVHVEFGNAGSVPDRGFFLLQDHDGVPLGNTNFFAGGVVFTNPAIETLTFLGQRGCRDDGSWTDNRRTFVLWEASRRELGLAATVEVERLTGSVQARP